MQIKDEFLKDSTSLLNLAYIFLKKGDLEKAEEFFKKALAVAETPENLLAYATHLLMNIMKDRVWRFGLIAKDINKLKEAEHLFSKAIGLLENTDRKIDLEEAYINRASVRTILDDFEQALEDIQAALNINPKSPNAYANRAKLNTLNKKLDNAIEDFQLAIKNGANKDELFPLLIVCYLERPDSKIDQAIEAINKYYTADEIEQNIIPSKLLIECLIKRKDYGKAQTMLKRLYDKFGRESGLLLIEAEMQKALGNVDSFEALIKEVDKNANGIEKNIANINLAKYYIEKKEYDKAIPLYESFVSENLFDEFLRDYLICLYKAKNNRSQNITKCLSICQNLRKDKPNIVFVINLEASIYEELDRLENVLDLYSELLKIEPLNYLHKLNHIRILIDIGKVEEEEIKKLAYEVKDLIDEKDKNSFILLAKCFLRLQQHEEAIKQAFKALELDSTNAETQLLYIYTFINRKNTKSALLESETVREDFYIKLKMDKQIQEYLIINNPAADITRLELYKDSALGKAIYGKKIGESITINNSGFQENIEILEIKSKYVKAFQNIINNFNTYFPGNRAIVKMEADPNKITELLKKTSERSSKIMDMYLSKKITIGALSEFSGKSLFVVWSALIERNSKIYCASGSSIEQKGEQELISMSSNIIIDPISLFTLAYLDLLEIPSKFFNGVYVSQSTMDEIDAEIMDLRKNQEEGFTTLFYYDNKPYNQKIEPEVIKEKIEFLLKIRNEKSIKVIGLDKPLEDDSNKKIEVMGRPYVYIIQNCLQKDLALFCDDVLFRELVQNEHKIKSFSTQNFLVMALQKKIITKESYFDKIIELAKRGYWYLSISAEMMFYYAEKTNFQIEKSEEFEVLLKILGSKETSLNSLVTVLADLIKLISIESLPSETKYRYLDAALQILVSRDNPRRILKIFCDILAKKLGLARYVVMPKINKMIHSWLMANCPIY